jgi:hypothetical protein
VTHGPVAERRSTTNAVRESGERLRDSAQPLSSELPTAAPRVEACRLGSILSCQPRAGQNPLEVSRSVRYVKDIDTRLGFSVVKPSLTSRAGRSWLSRVSPHPWPGMAPGGWDLRPRSPGVRPIWMLEARPGQSTRLAGEGARPTPDHGLRARRSVQSPLVRETLCLSLSCCRMWAPSFLGRRASSVGIGFTERG